MSSDASSRSSRAEPMDDLPNCVLGLGNREPGGEDQAGDSEVAVETEKGREGDGAVVVSEEVVKVEPRWLACEKDGGGLTGGASPGDVMDTG